MKVNRAIRRLTTIKVILLAMLSMACPPNEDDYVAPWPQNVIENNSFDESVPAGPLEEKANSLDDWNVEWHQPYYGAQLDRVQFRQLADSEIDFDEMVSHVDGGDSALHTGLYLASQAFRYHVTKSPEALENAKNTVDVLSHNLKVTGRRGYIARLRVPADYLFEQQNPGLCDREPRCHFVNEGPYAGDLWLGNTSMDMFKGWMFGMVTAYDLIDDEDTKAIIRADVGEVVTELINNDWVIQPPDIDAYNNPQFLPLARMSLAIQGYHVTGDARILSVLKEFLKDYYREIHDLFHLGDVFDFNKYADYYGNQLDHMVFYQLLRLGKFYFSEEDHTWLRNLFNDDVHTYTRLSHAPFLNMVYMSQGGWQPTDDDVYINQLLEDFGGLSGAPATYDRRPGQDPATYTVDPLSLNLSALRDAIFNTGIPELQKAVTTGFNAKPIATEPFPIHLQCSTPQYQANPYEICDTINDNWDEGPSWAENGQTYLVPYWMARYYGFIAKDYEPEVVDSPLVTASITETEEDEDKKGKKPKKPKKPKKDKKKKK